MRESVIISIHGVVGTKLGIVIPERSALGGSFASRQIRIRRARGYDLKKIENISSGGDKTDFAGRGVTARLESTVGGEQRVGRLCEKEIRTW